MLFMAGILTIFGGLHLVSRVGVGFLRSTRDQARIAIAVMFIVSGIMHFTSPGMFLQMMPPFLPAHLELVYVSGVFEILGAVGLLVPGTRRLAAYGLVALLVAVSPANIYVAVARVPLEGIQGNPIEQWTRLPFQAVYIWWLLWSVRPKQEARAIRQAQYAARA
jgi:uncharacterized membrane protein